jgi:hypothetical protein
MQVCIVVFRQGTVMSLRQQLEFDSKKIIDLFKLLNANIAVLFK